MVQVYFDGLCQPINPGGIACYAFLVKDEGITIHSDYGLATEPFSKDATNNVAEYMALRKALEWLLAYKMKSRAVRILSDSRVVVNQLNREFKIRA
ncbi:MAG: reverse transcriptase-like protein, partial [Nitrososphaera sp.]|nr:reverse transcriptase-like protein [Nitrososphaera sp.]